MKSKPGVEILSEKLGDDPKVERHKFYQFRLRVWLHHGDPIRWSKPWGLVDRGRLEDEGATLITDLRVDREFMFAGLFYGAEGMRLGGSRTLRGAPHLCFGATGVPAMVPPHALLTVDVTVISERVF